MGKIVGMGARKSTGDGKNEKKVAALQAELGKAKKEIVALQAELEKARKTE